MVEAGWYRDPSGDPGLRFWDGSAWTQYTTTANQPPPPPPAPPAAAQVQDGSAEAVSVLATLVPPNGVIVLYGGQERRPSRMAMTVGPDRSIPLETQRAFLELLQAVVIHEGYLIAYVDIDGTQGICAWHLVNGGIHALTADHAVDVLLYRDSVWPGIAEQDTFEFLDAPPLEAP